MSVQPEKSEYEYEPNPLSPRAQGSQAACSDDVWEKRAPNPRDVKFQQIVDNYAHQDDLANPQRDTVRYAWREYKTAGRLLRKSIKRWFSILPCRFWFHKSQPSPQYGKLLVCRRCGAWREND